MISSTGSLEQIPEKGDMMVVHPTATDVASTPPMAGAGNAGGRYR